MRYGKLWLLLAAVIVLSFATLGYFGHDIYRKAPPIPGKVVSADGQVLFTGQDVRDGQNVWQSLGGQEVGTVWGHGAYIAPDWSADWLHRESMQILNTWSASQHGKGYDGIAPEQQAALRERLKHEMRTNTYSAESDTLTLSADRTAAMKVVGEHYTALFGGDPAMQGLRKAYAIPANSIKDPERQRLLNAFFFWASWTCAAERPGAEVSYTNNWPSESLVGNHPSSSIVLWSVVSVIVLLAGVGALAWYKAVEKRREEMEEPHVAPTSDPLAGLTLTASMRATLKYFWVVAALLLTQIGMGALTAHYGVEGNGFFGFPLDQYLPYAVARTWHTQLGIFWIATAWLATGLFIAPAVSGYEPKWQRLGVNFLFVCLIIIVGGSMAGQWFAVQQKLGLTMNFWFGHQGYEYVDLGRFWQIFLFVGLVLWLGLMAGALLPALRKASESRHLLALFVLSAVAIGAFYGAGLMWGRQTHLAIAEYWRWWVVHLWVEGFFEVFATAVIGYLFTTMGLLNVRSATSATLFATAIFLSGGIIGTFHHLYFTGTPTAVLALGAVFSALEIVPLTLIGFEAYENLRLTRLAPWVARYRWPMLFFVSVAFWNLVGAGLFGFLINPPIALYYMQGLNLTPVHGHTALFGVYGMLGIGLMLFCLRALSGQAMWSERTLKFAFWTINIGLAAMVLLSLLPVGIAQTIASIDVGMWYARSAEFMQQDYLQTFRWLRAIGDTVFAVGALVLAWFVLSQRIGKPAATTPKVETKPEKLAPVKV